MGMIESECSDTKLIEIGKEKGIRETKGEGLERESSERGAKRGKRQYHGSVNSIINYQ